MCGCVCVRGCVERVIGVCVCVCFTSCHWTFRSVFAFSSNSSGGIRRCIKSFLPLPFDVSLSRLKVGSISSYLSTFPLTFHEATSPRTLLLSPPHRLSLSRSLTRSPNLKRLLRGEMRGGRRGRLSISFIF